MAAIYIITNKVTHEQYVGQTTNSVTHRFKKHISQRNCKNKCETLCAAFNKYGIENFEVAEIICGDFTKAQLNELEIFYIAHYKTLYPNGYNIQLGGQCSRNSLSTIKKISDTLKGREIVWKDKVSLGMTERWKDPEYKAKMKAAHTGKRGYKYKPHTKPNKLQLDDALINDLYKKGMSINGIAKQLKVSFGAIKKRINHA